MIALDEVRIKNKHRPLLVQPDDPFIRHVPLTRGLFAVVDAWLYDWIMQWNWCATYCRNLKYGHYAVRNSAVSEGRPRLILMHCQIVGLDYGTSLRIDHENFNGLDNRGTNLRLANSSQNGGHSRIPSSNTSGFKGVHWDKSKNLYVAQIKVNYRIIFLGRSSDPVKTALLYDEAAVKYFGSFAHTNFIDGVPRADAGH